MPNKTIIKLDASALSQSACLLRFKRIVLDGYTEKLSFNDTQYGSAFHKFIAVMYESEGDFGKATFAAQELFARPCIVRNGKKHLNELHLTKTCIDYWQHFQSTDNFEVLKSENKPLVEIDFAVKYYEDDKYIILLTGTIDKLGRFKNGCFAIGDYKTHSLWAVTDKINKSFEDIYIKTYFKQYEISNQLRFYSFVTKLLGQENPNSVFGLFNDHPFGVFIDGIFLSGTQSSRFARSDVFFFSENEMVSYRESLDQKISDLIFLANYQDYKLTDGIIQGTCNEGKFPCKFLNVCSNQDETIRKIVLKNEFTQKPYDPLTFSK
jgi:hypothetical protein